jgi:co-chaperonin GroES (HSP10)
MNRVLVQKLSEASKTTSGIFLPHSLKGATHMAKVKRTDD